MSDTAASRLESAADAPRALNGESRSPLGHLRIGEVPFEEVFPFITRERTRRDFTVAGRTYSVKMDSERYHIFAASRECVACGLVGTRLLLEMTIGSQSPHFNMYAEEDGKLVLMTKDHVLPKSLGGRESLQNLRTMCAPCNSTRGNDEGLTLEQIREWRGLPKRPHVNRIGDGGPLGGVRVAWGLVRVAYEMVSALTAGDAKRAHRAASDAAGLSVDVAEALESAEPTLKDATYEPRRWVAS